MVGKLRVGVISDTHLNGVTRELEALFEDHLAEADVILHAGDVVSCEVIEFLQQKPFYGVSGNMDPPDVRAALPGSCEIDLGSYRVGLIHGWGAAEGLEERVWDRFSNVDVIVYGHSHRPAVTTLGGVILFNPGTALGFSRDGKRSIGILELSRGISPQILWLKGER